MIRRSILQNACTTLLLVLLVAAPPARSQDRALQDRLDRLERDLSMLQRQVYHAGGGSAINASSGGAVDVELRMDRLEAQMRELTGRVEDAANGVELLRRRLEQINGDIDVRFGQGQGGPTSALPPPRGADRTAIASAAAGTLPVRVSPPSAAAPASSLPPGTLVPPPPIPAARSGTLTPPRSAPLVPESTSAAAPAGSRPPAAGGLPAGTAFDQYNSALGLIKQANYSAAEEALRSFIQKYPNDTLSSNAQYYLGDSYYQRERYAEAASAFAEGYKRYPKGAKAADDLLKLGMSLARANQKQNACVALAQLDHDFPNPGSAVKERAVVEKKRLGC